MRGPHQSLFNTYDLIESAEETLKNCHSWNAAALYNNEYKHRIRDEDVQLFGLVGLFRQLLCKLCKLYRRLSPYFGHGTFDPTAGFAEDG